MLVEVTTSLLAGCLVGYSFLQKQGGGVNDAAKIQRICTNNGLTVKENGEKKTMQLLRRSKIKDGGKVVGTECAFRIPLGLSFHDFENKKDNIQDGINNKQAIPNISFQDIKTLRLDRNLIMDIKTLLNKKKQLKKEIELSYDGVLKIKVFDEPLITKFDYEKGITDGWMVPVGKSRSGWIIHDFEKKAHIIVAGTTDFGKSNWVNCTINTLLTNKGDDVSFTLIDLKGGLEFNRYRHLKQVKAYAPDVEEARKALQSAVNQMDKVTEYLLEKGFSNVKEAGFKDRHFIVIDEAADMADDKDCQKLLKDIARKGRASGLRLIYTTQYPTAETISSQVKRNCIGRLCFVLDTATASQVVLDQGGAEKLSAIQGRALYKDLGLIEVQTPYISNQTIKETIQPHITFKARSDVGESIKGTTTRKHSLELEEIGLS
ncbi:FtsK/SpoIIIE domain-containing protein [Bacillus sp. DTU_2020_1000418_1_SI_GHA_SEK_038]|uniref:FtsK/SpoIIIE domain-containing protein n=1 Tax=Bacillus sp. DTU_2020_1000418_1_SI_GHA_SEK_038 TaxID=3077585 RepID=UPI0028E6C91F|nr:FtsK/SpoIIIE domain-containing protein [Bacillus sp. DTU_2020_1000418_1_SI_GHA_SEK_038]WNS74224.1 FtsK/SpoIIIE domain-containing protein [Bacillus sp. DTU_2020_1000418_1_SI_GHA_SEK_038]